MKVITFSRFFPAYHPRKGIDTFFPEQILNGLGIGLRDVPAAFNNLVNDFALMDGSKKHHTIRAGNRWKVGDWFSPRVWSGKPYASKQIEFAPPIEIKKIWSFVCNEGYFYVNGGKVDVTSSDIPANDGISSDDFLNWFPENKLFIGQIISWSNEIEY